MFYMYICALYIEIVKFFMSALKNQSPPLGHNTAPIENSLSGDIFMAFRMLLYLFFYQEGGLCIFASFS